MTSDERSVFWADSMTDVAKRRRKKASYFYGGGDGAGAIAQGIQVASAKEAAVPAAHRLPLLALPPEQRAHYFRRLAQRGAAGGAGGAFNAGSSSFLLHMDEDQRARELAAQPDGSQQPQQQQQQQQQGALQAVSPSKQAGGGGTAGALPISPVRHFGQGGASQRQQGAVAAVDCREAAKGRDLLPWEQAAASRAASRRRMPVVAARRPALRTAVAAALEAGIDHRRFYYPEGLPQGQQEEGRGSGGGGGGGGGDWADDDLLTATQQGPPTPSSSVGQSSVGVWNTAVGMETRGSLQPPGPPTHAAAPALALGDWLSLSGAAASPSHAATAVASPQLRQPSPQPPVDARFGGSGGQQLAVEGLDDERRRRFEALAGGSLAGGLPLAAKSPVRHSPAGANAARGSRRRRGRGEPGRGAASPKKLPPALPPVLFDPFSGEPQPEQQPPSSPLAPLRRSPSRHQRASPSRQRAMPGSPMVPINAGEHVAPSVMPGGEMMLTLQRDLMS